MGTEPWRASLELRVGAERRETERLLVLLGKIESRGLATAAGFPSLYACLTGSLGFSEVDAVTKLKAARACREFPALRRLLRSGRISMATISAIGPHLCRDNWKSLVRMTAGMPSARVRRIVASFSPREEPRQSVRYTDPGEAPLPRRVEIAFGAREDFLGRLERARALLRSKYPSGRFEDIFDEAIEALVEKADRGSPGRPLEGRRARIGVERPKGRYVPQAVRREVWRRDGGRCAYRASDGTRCEETTRLEFDHVMPFALGGPSRDPDNIRLLCRGHNQFRLRHGNG